MEKMIYDQQEHEEKDLNYSDCQELDQERYEAGSFSCLESGLEPEPDYVSFLPSLESDQHQCFCVSPTVLPHCHECHHCGRRMLPPSNPSPGSASVSDPTSQQKKMEQEDFETKLLSHKYAKMTLPGNNHRLPAGLAPERSVVVPSFLKTATPSKPKLSSPLPPLPPLCRTTSDPTPAKLPHLPAPAIKYGNVNVEESPISRRLKRNRHQLKKKIVEENKIHQETEKDGAEAENDQETVSAEKIGDHILVQFKCPCGRGYKILFAGRHCYYKLVE